MVVMVLLVSTEYCSYCRALDSTHPISLHLQGLGVLRWGDAKVTRRLMARLGKRRQQYQGRRAGRGQRGRFAPSRGVQGWYRCMESQSAATSSTSERVERLSGAEAGGAEFERAVCDKLDMCLCTCTRWVQVGSRGPIGRSPNDFLLMAPA